LSQLKNQLQTNKALVSLPDSLADVSLWNDYLSQQQLQLQAVTSEANNSNTSTAVTNDSKEAQPSWFFSSWLYVECYFYRRIISAISFSKCLKDLDPFRQQKQAAFVESYDASLALLTYLSNTVPQSQNYSEEATCSLFNRFIHVALWGNKCDLSISSGSSNSQHSVDILDQLQRLSQHVLHDDWTLVWTYLHSLHSTLNDTQCCQEEASNNLIQKRSLIRIDIVLDNAGFELVTDLCLAELLMSRSLADVIHFHVKQIPWFVSDVTLDDWNWTLSRLSLSSTDRSSSSSSLSEQQSLHHADHTTTQSTCNHRESSIDDPDSLGYKFRSYIKSGSWIVKSHVFWTLPHDFSEMKTVSPDLYADLSRSHLIIFKGDLNYRKLVGDLKWPDSTSFQYSLRGFQPTSLLTLRTLKSDLVVGLLPGKADEAAKHNTDWMVSGSYGVIQFLQN